MKKVYDVKAKMGSYKDRNGEMKNSYSTIGTGFEDTETGKISLNIKTLPVVGFDGWLQFYEKQEKQTNPY
jgi:hypothetical protein